MVTCTHACACILRRKTTVHDMYFEFQEGRGDLLRLASVVVWSLSWLCRTQPATLGIYLCLHWMDYAGINV